MRGASSQTRICNTIFLYFLPGSIKRARGGFVVITDKRKNCWIIHSNSNLIESDGRQRGEVDITGCVVINMEGSIVYGV